MYKFDVKTATEDCINWIRDFFKNNGPNCKAIIGISGGKDSTIVAKLCVEALGADRVYGVLMPDGYSVNNIADTEIARRIVNELGIDNVEVDIHDVILEAKNNIIKGIYGTNNKQIIKHLSDQSRINLPPRIRMSILYAISQSINGRVANTCNLSEDYVGYSTRYGDSVGDFSPLSHFTVTEIRQIGDYLGLPKDLVYKTPSDGLCGKTDEDNLGFTYEDLDRHIRCHDLEDKDLIDRIEKMHTKNLFKLQLMPAFEYNPQN